jgi:formylglycine-generating enzyme required for sulfatase activity
MVSVPGGTFSMGSAAGEGDDRERPRTRVTLDPYCIDRTEVTVGMYQQCVQSGPCAPAPPTVQARFFRRADIASWSQFCNAERNDRLEHPINCVDWEQADAYCRWSGGRLPTEAEWEYAARGSDGRRYPWGNARPGPTRLNALGGEGLPGFAALGLTFQQKMYDGDDGWLATAPVGSYPSGATRSGVVDLAGNVSEWTSDWYGPYAGRAASNPQGASPSELRVTRGGGWFDDEVDTVRGASRSAIAPGDRHHDLGFRCARRID